MCAESLHRQVRGFPNPPQCDGANVRNLWGAVLDPLPARKFIEIILLIKLWSGHYKVATSHVGRYLVYLCRRKTAVAETVQTFPCSDLEWPSRLVCSVSKLDRLVLVRLRLGEVL